MHRTSHLEVGRARAASIGDGIWSVGYPGERHDWGCDEKDPCAVARRPSLTLGLHDVLGDRDVLAVRRVDRIKLEVVRILSEVEPGQCGSRLGARIRG